MANNQFNLSQEQARVLINSAPTTFNLATFTPTASTFKLTEEVLKKELFACAKTYISDFTTLTLEVNRKTGAITAYVWLSKNSSHLQDNATNSERSAIRKPIIRYSKEIKEFMDKFCDSDKRRTFIDENSNELVGIEIRIDLMLRVIFDESGAAYQEKYGTRNRFRTKIELTAFFKKSDESNFGKLNYVKVEKKLASDVLQHDPKPRKSHRI